MPELADSCVQLTAGDTTLHALAIHGASRLASWQSRTLPLWMPVSCRIPEHREGGWLLNLQRRCQGSQRRCQQPEMDPSQV